MDYAFNVSLDLWILIIYVLGEFEIKTNLEISMARNYFLPSFKSLELTHDELTVNK